MNAWCTQSFKYYMVGVATQTKVHDVQVPCSWMQCRTTETIITDIYGVVGYCSTRWKLPSTIWLWWNGYFASFYVVQDRSVMRNTGVWHLSLEGKRSLLLETESNFVLGTGIYLIFPNTIYSCTNVILALQNVSNIEDWVYVTHKMVLKFKATIQ